MKRFYEIREPIEGKPARLVASVVLAIIIMTFINGFIGGMGGIPAFIAFFAVFYSLRVLVGAGSRVAYREGLTDGGIVGRMMGFYTLGYLFLWAVFRLVLTFSRLTGWGNINRGGALESLRELFTASVLERWAYLFAGLLMLAFILSLFPLVVIRRQNQWVVYALLDGAGFALVTVLVGGISTLVSGGRMTERGVSLVECLLVSGRHAWWQELLYLACVLLFLAAVACFAFFFARYCYRTQKDLTEEETNWLKSSIRSFQNIRPGQRRRTVALIAGCVAAVGVVALIIMTAPKGTQNSYTKVAEYLTDDSWLGPMEYRGQVYILVEEELTLHLDGAPKGYLAEKGEACDSRLYELTVANVLYLDPTGSTGHLQVYGERIGSFAPVKELEADESWRRDTEFVLWDEDWMAESAYSHEPTGYTVCAKDFVEALEEKYGEVEYRAEDFDAYDAYFSLYGYADLDAALTGEKEHGHWIGCILVRGNRFYYGSYANEITGALLAELLDVLGGY